MQLDRLLNFGGFRSFNDINLVDLIRRWHTDVLACLPLWLRRSLGGERADLILDVSGPHIQAQLLRPTDSPLPLGKLEVSDTNGVRDVLLQAHRAQARVILVIPGQEVLVRRVQLPAQVREQLGQVLGYELDRLTPFHAQDLYYGFRSPPGSARQQLEVELAVVRRTVVDGWLQYLRDVGGAADVVTWPTAWPNANLLPLDQRRRPEQAGRLLRIVLGLLLFCLAGAALVSPLLQKRSIVIDLNAQVEQARTRAARVADLRTRIEQEEKSSNFVVEQKRTAHALVPLLARLTELIPDGTWIKLLNYGSGQVDFSGESKQATALIELLARDPAFHNIIFRSPVIGVRGSDKERFHIQLDYIGTQEVH